MQERQEWHESKMRQTQMVVAHAQGLGHHLLVPSQYMGDGPSVKGFRACGLAVVRLLSGECFVGMTFLPKEINTGWDNLMHAIEVGVET